MKKRLSIILTAVTAILLSVTVLGADVKAASEDDSLNQQYVEAGEEVIDMIAGGSISLSDFLVYYGVTEEDAAAAQQSFDETMEKLGNYQGYDDEKSSASIDSTSGDGSITIVLDGENRTGTAVITVEGGGIALITFSSEDTLAEAVEKAGLNTIIGLCMAFGVLTLIAIIIWLVFPQINKWSEGNEKKKKAAAAPAPKAAPAPAVAAVEEEDDGELVAVIAAAIAASEGKQSSDGFVVRSIRRHF